MLFPSILFILYFLPVALLLYLACGFSRFAQNVCLLALSLVFYAWGEPLHLAPLLFVILVNYALGLLLTEDKQAAYRRNVIKAAVALNIGMLLFVRYGGALAGEISILAGGAALAQFPPPPLGVSFFTLQALAYVFDVSRRKAVQEKNIVNAGLYMAFFPTVLAGPILRYADVAWQIRNRTITLKLLGKGAARFVIGLAKLLLLAGPLSLVAGHVFGMSAAGSETIDVPVMLAWLGLVAFSLQIYLTFSGYSDMAIGVAAMFGFSLKENFNYPYTAKTVSGFWKRWHISLFRWFYTYVYLALGAARPRRVRVRGAMRSRNFVLRNLFVLWLLIGLWHGLHWTYVIWGMWFFIFFLFEWIVRLPYRKLTSPVWHVYLLFIVCIGWVFFRCHSVGESLNYFSNLLGLGGNGFYSDLAVVFVRENLLPFLLGLLFCTPVMRKAEAWIGSEKTGVIRSLSAVVYPAVLAGLFCLSLVYLARQVHIPFVF